MEPRLSMVTLGVTDIERSRAFYEALGFRASSASVADTVFFQLGGIALGIWKRNLLAADTGLMDQGGFGGMALAHNVRSKPEVDALLSEAARAGGHILKPAHEADWGGYTGYFADPDNHPWEVAWNPHFVLGDNGAMTLPV